MNEPGLDWAKLLPPECIHLNLAGTGSDTVLEELAGRVPSLSAAQRSQLVAALREREAVHSTGVGDGVALPHTRDALDGAPTGPVVVMGRHLAGVDFRALDGRPVHLFFLILATNLKEHLALLARLSRMLRRPAVRKALLAAADPAAVLEVVTRAQARP